MTRDNTQWFIGVYWGHRMEPVASCAERASSMLARFADLGVGSGRWVPGHLLSRAGAPTRDWEWETGLDALIRFGQTRDDEGAPMPTAGYAFELSDPARSWAESIRMNVLCSATAPRLVNRVVVEGEPLVGMDDRRLLEALVRAWAPDRGVVSTPEMVGAAKSAAPRLRPLVGRRTYFGPTTGLTRVAQVENARIETLGEGVLMTTADAPLGEDLPGQVQDACALAVELEATLTLR